MKKLKGLQITVETANVKSINDMSESYDHKNKLQTIENKKETEPLNIDRLLKQSIDSASQIASVYKDSEQYAESIKVTEKDSKRNTVRLTWYT